MNRFLYLLMAVGFLIGLGSASLREAIVRTLGVDEWFALILAPFFAAVPFYCLKVAFDRETPPAGDDLALNLLRDADLDAPMRMYYFGGFLLVSSLDLFLLWRAMTGK
jgi:hypothetical protein